MCAGHVHSRGLSTGHAEGGFLPGSACGHPSVCVWVLISSSYKDTNPVGSGSHPVTSFTVITSIKTCKQSPSVVLQVRASAQNSVTSSALHDPLAGLWLSPSSCLPHGQGAAVLALSGLPGLVVVWDHLPGLLLSPCPSPERKPAGAASVCLKLSIPHGDACGESCCLGVCAPTTHPQSPVGSDRGGARG